MSSPTYKSAFVIYLIFGIFNLAFTATLVYQNGDTLKFMNGDSVIATRVMSTETVFEPVARSIATKAKTSAEHDRYFVYQETCFLHNDSIVTSLTLYSSDQKKLWQRAGDNNHRISYELTDLRNDILILVTTNQGNTNPRLEFIRDRKARTVIRENQWQRITEYAISPNDRFIVLHTKNSYQGKSWDYVYFIDLKTNKTWSYLFPMCVSCKRNRLDMKVDDEGITEVIYKNEHRLFSRNGTLTDVFMTME